MAMGNAAPWMTVAVCRQHHWAAMLGNHLRFLAAARSIGYARPVLGLISRCARGTRGRQQESNGQSQNRDSAMGEHELGLAFTK